MKLRKQTVRRLLPLLIRTCVYVQYASVQYYDEYYAYIWSEEDGKLPENIGGRKSVYNLWKEKGYGVSLGKHDIKGTMLWLESVSAIPLMTIMFYGDTKVDIAFRPVGCIKLCTTMKKWMGGGAMTSGVSLTYHFDTGEWVDNSSFISNPPTDRTYFYLKLICVSLKQIKNLLEEELHVPF